MLQQIMHLFQQGGPVMYVLAACSLFTVTIAIERFLYYRNISRRTHEFQQKLHSLLEKQRLPEALHLCEQSSPHVLAAVAFSGLMAYQQCGHCEIALESAASLAAARLRERLSDISMIVTLAPLLGLLGTVIGMIHSFSVLDVQSHQPAAITGGVGEALVSTATGLVVATLSLVLHNLLSRRANRLITDIEQIAALVVGSISIKKAARRDAHEIA